MPLFDVLSVMLVSVAATLATEAVSWFLVYRTPAYKTLRARMEKIKRKLKAIESGEKAAAQSKKGIGQKEALEEEMQGLQRQLAASSFRSTVPLMVIMGSVYYTLASSYEGVVVARLPFAPVSLLQGITRRGLIGNDVYECSFLFIYVLSGMALRPTIQKALGTAPPRGASPFAGIEPPKQE